MKKQHRKFIKKLKKYLNHSGAENLRITQALYNLGVTIKAEVADGGYLLDNYNESDKVILDRMKRNMKNNGRRGKKAKI